jgi:hypothetical protein
VAVRHHGREGGAGEGEGDLLPLEGMGEAVKVASFHVRATEAQSIRWKRAAEAEGYASAGSWLAEAADAYLKVRARAGRPIPLAWRRGRFPVALEDGETTVRGFTSEPFHAFRGSFSGPMPTGDLYSLVYRAHRRHVAHLRPSARIGVRDRAGHDSGRPGWDRRAAPSRGGVTRGAGFLARGSAPLSL